MVKAKKVEPKLVSVTVYCPNLNKNIEDTTPMYYSSTDECACCGSHGAIEITISCECKNKYHTVIVYEW